MTIQSVKNDTIIIVLSAFSVLFALLPIPLINRLSHVYGLTFSLATLIMPFYYMLFDIISEVYNRKIAVYLMILSVFMDILFSLAISLIILFPTPINWRYESSYNFVFSSAIRLSLLGGIALILSQSLNIYLITWLKQLVKGKYFWIRAIGSSGIGEIVVSILIGCVFIGRYNTKTIIQIVIMSYILKLCGTIVLSPFGSVIVTILKKHKQRT